MTKKFLSILLTIVMVLSIAPVTVFAEDDILSYLTYEITDGEVTITGCDNSISGDVVIPDTIEGYPVTTIGYYAFARCYGLTSVIIPDSVKTVSNGAFNLCQSMTSLTIGESVTTIGTWAFNGCTGLTRINWNAKNVTDIISYDEIMPNAGKNGDGIELIFGDNVEKIPSFIFFCDLYNASKISSITIGNSVKTIGTSAFENCKSLTSVTFGDSVTTIGDNAFYGCSGLTDIKISDTVNTIGDNAFYGCSGLTDIKISDTVTTIGDNAFYGCSGLTNVKIGDAVKTIGDNAFYDCTELTSVTIGESVTKIGDSAFAGCTGLTKINWNAKSISNVTLANIFCSAGIYGEGIELIFGDNVEELPSYFSELYKPPKVTSIIIGKSVKTISGHTFQYCSNLESIKIYNPECSIYDYAYTIDDGAIIYGYTGSTAQAYAEKYNRKFVAFDPQVCDHLNTEIINIVEANCDNDGYTGDVYCKDCEEIISYGETVSAKGHTDADGDDFCDVCDTVLSVGSGDDSSDNDTSDNGSGNFFDSIIALFNKIIAWIKSLFGIA